MDGWIGRSRGCALKQLEAGIRTSCMDLDREKKNHWGDRKTVAVTFILLPFWRAVCHISSYIDENGVNMEIHELK